MPRIGASGLGGAGGDDFLRKDGTTPLTGTWDVGNESITDVATLSVGTATIPSPGVATFMGNVGFGITTPTDPIHALGTVRIGQNGIDSGLIINARNNLNIVKIMSNWTGGELNIDPGFLGGQMAITTATGCDLLIAPNGGATFGSYTIFHNNTVGIGMITAPGAILHVSNASAASLPGEWLSGTWFTGGSSTTTKPHLLVEPNAATSTAWSTDGTGVGINAESGFIGNLLDAQLDGSTQASIDSTGMSYSQGLKIQSGTNKKIGTAVLIGGTVTVSNTSITSNSLIYLTSQVDGGTPGSLRITAKTVGTSFDITSSNILDTSTVAWVIIESAP